MPKASKKHKNFPAPWLGSKDTITRRLYSIFKVSRIKTRVSGVCRKKNTRRKIGRGKLTRMKFIRTDSFGQAIYTFAFPTYFRRVCVFLLSVSRCTVEISPSLHHCGHFRFLDPSKFFFFFDF